MYLFTGKKAKELGINPKDITSPYMVWKNKLDEKGVAFVYISIEPATGKKRKYPQFDDATYEKLEMTIGN